MVVIIPAKPFEQAKTRLAPLLSPAQRASLSRHLLRRTIRLARQVGDVVVISQASAVRHLAKQNGAWALVESHTGLNAALQQASKWAAAQARAATLILPADLPLLTLADLTEITALAKETPAIVIAPCRRHDGTNALLVQPPNLIEFTFGPNSFQQHRRLARAAGIEPKIYQSPTVALDLDYPEDLKRLYPDIQLDKI